LAKRTARIRFTLKRIKGFLNALRRSKRGMVGIGILIIAIVVAFAAPMMTPYNPLWTFNLAADWAQPSWMKYLPGGGGVTANMYPVVESALLQRQDWLKGYNITVMGSAQSKSNLALANVSGTLFVSISPTFATLSYGSSQLFIANTPKGKSSYSYQWYVNGSAVSDATGSTWSFYPTFAGSYIVYVKVTNSAGLQATSNMATVKLKGFLASISPSSVTLDVGQSQTFTSTVSGGKSPYTYQWFLNNAAVPGATNASWTFTPSWPLGTFSYSLFLLVNSGKGVMATSILSNEVIVTLKGLLSVSISPTLAALNSGKSQSFTSNVSGGQGSYTYQWYLNGAAVPGATKASWTFTPSSAGSYSVYLRVTDNEDTKSQNSVTVQHSAFGMEEGGPGSLAVSCQAAGFPINSSLTIQITTDFYYPYSGIPGSMNASGAILLSTMDGVTVSPSLILRQNWPTYKSPGVASYNVTSFGFGYDSLGNPVPIAFGESNFTNGNSRSNTLGWQSPKANLIYESSGLGLDMLYQELPRAGSYSYGIRMTVDTLTANAKALVYIDNLNLWILGNSWGLLGTDGQGRDVFTQLVYGTQISLYVGLVSAVIGVFIGLLVGLVAAYVGGIVDEVLMRFTDALLVLPGLPLMIVLITVLANGQYNLNIFIMVIGFLGWMGFARVVRSQVLSLKERPYVEAAKAVGAGTPYILIRHILPNVVVLIYVTLALSVPGAIVAEAAFSFLGFIDVNRMSWGRMLNSVINKAQIWWVIIPPGLAIAGLSLSFILIGYAMDDILNPKLRARR
jgi:peptide/nickel transport system permease protein